MNTNYTEDPTSSMGYSYMQRRAIARFAKRFNESKNIVGSIKKVSELYYDKTLYGKYALERLGRIKSGLFNREDYYHWANELMYQEYALKGQNKYIECAFGSLESYQKTRKEWYDMWKQLGTDEKGSATLEWVPDFPYYYYLIGSGPRVVYMAKEVSDQLGIPVWLLLKEHRDIATYKRPRVKYFFAFYQTIGLVKFKTIKEECGFPAVVALLELIHKTYKEAFQRQLWFKAYSLVMEDYFQGYPCWYYRILSNRSSVSPLIHSVNYRWKGETSNARRKRQTNDSRPNRHVRSYGYRSNYSHVDTIFCDEDSQSEQGRETRRKSGVRGL